MRQRQGVAATLFLAPYFGLFFVFLLVPVLYGFWISLHEWHILSDRAAFVGLRNYQSVVRDDLFGIALARTLFFVALVVPAGNAVSLLMAVGLNQRYRGTTIFKIAFYLPVLLSVAVVAVLWRWLYAAEFGLINLGLSAVSQRPIRVPWLTDPNVAMPAIAILSIWWGAGANMLIYLAALRGVPKEILEAASLDGASPVARFWRVTFAQIRPAVLFCFVMSVIAASQVFGQSYILTGGGPAYSTLTVVLYTYQQGFGMYQMGYASAIAYVLFAIVLVLTLLQFRLLRPTD